MVVLIRFIVLFFLDQFAELPNQILVKIFSNFSPHELMIYACVCKKFRTVCRSDQLWEKFVMTIPGILPKEGNKISVFQHMWANSIIIGKERWYPVKLPDLAAYDAKLRKEEMQQCGEASEAALAVYHRLNPMYPLTTDCINNEKPAMVEIVQLLFDYFGYVDKLTPEERQGMYDYEEYFVRDARTCNLWSHYVSKPEALLEILNNLESTSILNPDITIEVDLSGNRINLDAANYRLNEDLFNQIKAIVDKSRNYAIYRCNYGSTIMDYTTIFPFSRVLVVGDEFAMYSVRCFPPPTDM